MSLIPSYFYSTLSCRVLVGTGRACYETLRPLAYSLLAELIHHVRLDLSLPQVLSESLSISIAYYIKRYYNAISYRYSDRY